MHELDQTLFMPPTESYADAMSDIYNYDCPSYPDPSAYGWNVPQSEFGNTVDSMFDPSTGGTWQPLDITESSIDPALIAMSGPSLDTSSGMPATFAFTGQSVTFPSQSLDYFDPTSYAPFSPEVVMAAPAYPVSTANTKVSSRPRRERGNPAPRKLPQQKKTYQPAINPQGCWCDLCTGPAPKISVAYLAKLTKPEHERKAIGKQYRKLQNAKRHRATPAKRGPQLKRKARKQRSPVTNDYNADRPESESDEAATEDGEYRPAIKITKTAGMTRRRSTRQNVGNNSKKIPKGLDIDMNG
ncbi:MAG: hypothetical protein Q9178_000231 [Gyalolechia marmorata]